MNAAFKTLAILALALVAGFADARGGASSGGGGHGGGGGHASSSSGRGGFSSAPASRPAPAPAPAPAAVSRPAPAPAQAAPVRTTTTTTTTSSVNTSSRSVTPAGNYGGMGAGYYHNDGLLTGLIIGNMMHPQNTVVYAGGGAHSNNALLYPDGRVVNQNGQQVGTYQNGQFTEMQNGPTVAQPVPQEALKPVEKEKTVMQWLGDILAVIALVIAIIFLFVFLRSMLK